MGAQVGALLTFGGDDGLQVLAFPPLLSGVPIGCIICRTGDLLGFVYGGLFDVISIHGTSVMSHKSPIRDGRQRRTGRGRSDPAVGLFAGLLLLFTGTGTGWEH
jgi:hypothetical protein